HFHETTQQMCDPRTWYRSEFFNEVMQPSRYDHYLVSVVGLSQRAYSSVIGLTRHVGDKPFGQRERRIVGLLHEELAGLWRTPALGTPPQWRQRLTPRLRGVLDCWLQGLSEKQVALRLGIRRTTVHNHIE